MSLTFDSLVDASVDGAIETPLPLTRRQLREQIGPLTTEPVDEIPVVAVVDASAAPATVEPPAEPEQAYSPTLGMMLPPDPFAAQSAAPRFAPLPEPAPVVAYSTLDFVTPPPPLTDVAPMSWEDAPEFPGAAALAAPPSTSPVILGSDATASAPLRGSVAASAPAPDTPITDLGAFAPGVPVEPSWPDLLAPPLVQGDPLPAPPQSRMQDRRWESGVVTPQRWTTGGSIAVAVTPWIGLLSSAGLVALLLLQPGYGYAPFAVLVVPFLWSIAAASRDIAALGHLGYTKLPGLGWLFLSPLPYLISRTIKVRAESGRGWAPLWLYIASCLVAPAIGSAAAMVLLAPRH